MRGMETMHTSLFDSVLQIWRVFNGLRMDLSFYSELCHTLAEKHRPNYLTSQALVSSSFKQHLLHYLCEFVLSKG